jgi:4-alpha-glucanotransferase
MRPQPPLGRSAGLVVPLFSLQSASSGGIGEIPDLAALRPWLERAGLRAVQLLPVGTLPAGEASPYSALSAMAIDPVYVSLADVSDYAALGGDVRLPLADQLALRTARSSPRVHYAAVRQAKESALRLAFSLLWDVDWLRTTARAGAFASFVSWEEWWLGDYALYCALREKFGNTPWRDWPEPLARRDHAALDEVRRELDQEIFYHQYVQWLADMQWEAAREALGDIRLFGDFPFMVSADSADVWAHQSLFSRQASVGTPPDAFSETGQDWGLPVYLRGAMRADDFGWLRARGRRMAAMFDGFRIDHLVGFYRTYWRPANGQAPYFEPRDEDAQRQLGEDVVAAFASAGAALIAEDLGTIPDFVRASLEALQLPGYKVMRWERDWHAEGQPFHDPARYAATSLATTGTHDTDMLADWWDTTTDEERAALLAVPGLRDGGFTPDQPYDDRLRDAMIRLLLQSGSDLVIFPLQDLFGWRDRINVPATVGPDNWSWVSRVPIDTLLEDPVGRERAETLRKMVAESRR